MLGDGDSSSGLSLSSSDEDEDCETSTAPPSFVKKSVAPKKGALSYEELTKHGYSSGLSVLNVPAPRQNTSGDQDWSWSGGKRKSGAGDDDLDSESYAQREATRKLTNDGAEQLASETLKEHSISKKQRRDAAAEERGALSFSKKEKRKRDMGQTSRGKSYVEEEKRLLRDHKVYSGFD